MITITIEVSIDSINYIRRNDNLILRQSEMYRTEWLHAKTKP